MKYLILTALLLSSTLLADNRPEIWSCGNDDSSIYIKKGQHCTTLNFTIREPFSTKQIRVCGNDIFDVQPIKDQQFKLNGVDYDCFEMHKDPVYFKRSNK